MNLLIEYKLIMYLHISTIYLFDFDAHITCQQHHQIIPYQGLNMHNRSSMEDLFENKYLIQVASLTNKTPKKAPPFRISSITVPMITCIFFDAGKNRTNR